MRHRPKPLKEAIKINRERGYKETEKDISGSSFDNAIDFGKQVLTELKKRGATQSDLAVSLGVSRQRVQQAVQYGYLGGPIARRIASALDMELHISLAPRRSK